MDNNEYHEKDEKQEKELQKQEEKSPEEKNYEEKYRRDPLGTSIWAVILIWVGAVLLGDNLGLLSTWMTRLSDRTVDLPFDIDFGVWSLIFLGIAGLLLIEVLIRLIMPEYRQSITGKVILVMVFVGVGLGTWDLIWPMILIALGLSIIGRGLFKRK